MEVKMATVEKAEELLEKLRNASWGAAVQGTILLLSGLIIVFLLFLLLF